MGCQDSVKLYGLLIFLSSISLIGTSKGDKTTINTSPYTLQANNAHRLPSSEPYQRAIILFDDRKMEEILFLSTDLSYGNDIVFLESIPFPSEPNAKVGNIQIFSDMIKIAAEKNVRLEGIAPTAFMEGPAGQVGSVTDINIAQLRTPAVYENYVLHLQRQLSLQEGMHAGVIGIANRYQKRGYSWFAFNSVWLKDVARAFAPIEYKFKTDKLFYPLETSIYGWGKTQVDLILITKHRLKHFSTTEHFQGHRNIFELRSNDLARLSPGWAEFFDGGSVHVEHVRIAGDIQQMTRDFLAD